MSYEETLVCDSCSAVIDGGSRASTTKSLADHGGRFFTKRLDGWSEVLPTAVADRHLCGACSTAPEFYDGVKVPVSMRPDAATPEGTDA